VRPISLNYIRTFEPVVSLIPSLFSIVLKHDQITMSWSRDISTIYENGTPRRTISLTRYPAQTNLRNASLLEEVVIPPHLLRAARNSHQTWQPQSIVRVSDNRADSLPPIAYYQTRDEARRSSLQHRTASVDIGGLSRSRVTGFDTTANRFAVATQNSDPRAPLYRKTSLPTIGEGLPSSEMLPALNSSKLRSQIHRIDGPLFSTVFRAFHFSSPAVTVHPARHWTRRLTPNTLVREGYQTDSLCLAT
jgi:hypothetical protein